MNGLSEREFNLLSDAVRRRQRATADAATADALNRHAVRAMSYLDDLAEGESVNGKDYQVARAAMILHEVAATKVRSKASAEASAGLAAEMLSSIGADDFAEPVSQAISRHRSKIASTCAELLVHDACLLARMELLTGSKLNEAKFALRTSAARKIAVAFTDNLEREPATI